MQIHLVPNPSFHFYEAVTSHPGSIGKSKSQSDYLQHFISSYLLTPATVDHSTTKT